MLSLLETAPLAAALLGAIRAGHLDDLARLLRDNPGVSSVLIERPCVTGPSFFYPLIAAATDWPGNFPRAGASIAALIAQHTLRKA